MHDFIQHLSFSPFALESSSGGDTAGAIPSRLTTAATVEPLRCVVLSFNEPPAAAFRPSPRRHPKSHRLSGSKSLSSQLSALN